jgi:hypothetical protein
MKRAIFKVKAGEKDQAEGESKRDDARISTPK